MKTDTEINISKLEAAKRQLETAISLYFAYQDPVAIHTLASAAYAILNDTSKIIGVNPRHSRSDFIQRARPGKEKELNFYLKRYENFFKHADKDHDEIINFNPLSSEFVIFDSILIYFALTNGSTPLMNTFYFWWRYSYRHLLRPEFREELEKLEWFSGYFNDRKTCYEIVFPIFSKK